MIPQELVEILACPETKQPVRLLLPAELDRINSAVTSGVVKTRGGAVAKDLLEAGLLRGDGQVLYPVRGGIPIMLVEEGIELQPTGIQFS